MARVDDNLRPWARNALRLLCWAPRPLWPVIHRRITPMILRLGQIKQDQ